MSVMGCLMTTVSQGLGLIPHPKNGISHYTVPITAQGLWIIILGPVERLSPTGRAIPLLAAMFSPEASNPGMSQSSIAHICSSSVIQPKQGTCWFGCCCIFLKQLGCVGFSNATHTGVNNICWGLYIHTIDMTFSTYRNKEVYVGLT